ncbi:MAG: alpha/beta hydrolase-fold protein [bacterium]|nr:alpha/beta hydrolase-fold protein [bacterium]
MQLPRVRLPFLLALAASLTPILAQAGSAQIEPVQIELGKIVERTYRFEQAGEREQDYALFVPKNYDAKQPTPLVVLLHGLNSNPQQVIRYAGITKHAGKLGAIVVAPFGYNGRGWYGSRGPGKKGPFFGRKNDPDNLGELSELDVLNVLEIVRRDFTIDPKRIFLMGHSMGGAGTVHLGAKFPTLWAGLAPLAPALDGRTGRLDTMKQLPVYVVTGAKDRLVRVGIVRRWVAAMKEREMDHEYLEIAGGDHVRSIARNAEMIAGIFEWFAGKQRTAPAPSVASLRTGNGGEGKAKDPAPADRRGSKPDRPGKLRSAEPVRG